MRIPARSPAEAPWYLCPFFWNQRRKYDAVLDSALFWAWSPRFFFSVAPQGFRTLQALGAGGDAVASSSHEQRPARPHARDTRVQLAREGDRRSRWERRNRRKPRSWRARSA